MTVAISITISTLHFLPIESSDGVDLLRPVSLFPCHSRSIPIECICLPFLRRVVSTFRSFLTMSRAQFSVEGCLKSNAEIDFLIQQSGDPEGGEEEGKVRVWLRSDQTC
jgi:hypothetical protein